MSFFFYSIVAFLGSILAFPSGADALERTDLAGRFDHDKTGRTLASAFDPLNRLESITDTVSPSVPGKTTGYRYDLSGNLLVKNQANGTVENSSYDALGRRRFQQTLSGGTSITCFSYAHDAVGNVKTITENPMSTGLPDRKITNTYDRVYRLIREKADSSALAGTPASTTVTRYGYDKANNRTLKEGETLRGSTLLESFDAVSVYGSAANGANSNQLVSYDDSKTGKTTAYTYDANGNLQTRAVTGGGTETLHWDSSNRLVRVEQPAESKTHEYGYDYRSRRVIRDESGADGENSLVSFSGGTSAFETVGTSVAVEYIRGSDSGGGVGGVLYSSRNGVESFNSYNSRGDVVAQTGAGGSVKWEASYEAFGTRTAESGSNTDRHRANTKEEDPTGFLNEGHRYRDLATGVFISRDPAGFVDGPNVYTYVNQNPWSSFDPSGLATSILNDGTTSTSTEIEPYPLSDQAESGQAINDNRGQQMSGSDPGMRPGYEDETSESAYGGSARRTYEGVLIEDPMPFPQVFGNGVMTGDYGEYNFGSNTTSFNYSQIDNPAIHDFSEGAFTLYGLPGMAKGLWSLGGYGLERAGLSFAANSAAPQVLRNQVAGNAARDAIAAARPGSLIEQNFRVTGGLRRVDVLDGATAIESKVGRTSLTPAVRQELARDIKIMRSDQGVNAVEWHFSPSPTTGLGGPTGPLRAKLNKFGISIVE